MTDANTINDAMTQYGGSDSALGRIDQYELQRELGGGGFGTVYLARDMVAGDTLMVMEYAPGVTLSKWRRQFPDGKVPLEQALQIVWQVAQALDFAHEQHILHSSMGRVSRAIHDTSGTRPYMAPPQGGRNQVDLQHAPSRGSNTAGGKPCSR